MMKLKRYPAPDFLQEHYKKWGHEFAAKRKKNPGYKFSWKRYNGRDVGERLREELKRMCRKHCSFCDSYPLGVSAAQTIEHFRPKSKYPLLAYVWHNLFLCCNVCQTAKKEKFDKKLLKPDKTDYQFEKYFILNYKDGYIEINPLASLADQERAALTIEIYGLNRYGRPHSRLLEYKKYQQLFKEDFCIDDFSYRYFLE